MKCTPMRCTFTRYTPPQYGFDALMTNVKDTCVACAIREAYATYVSVVILTEGGRKGETEGVVDGVGGSEEDDEATLWMLMRGLAWGICMGRRTFHEPLTCYLTPSKVSGL